MSDGIPADFTGVGLIITLSSVILISLALLRHFIREEREIEKIAGRIFLVCLVQSLIFWLTSFIAHTKIRYLHFIVSHIIHTGTFLSAALYINQFINVHLWKYIGEKSVPTFIKSAVTFLVYMLSIAAIVKFIFVQDEKALIALTGGIVFLLGYAAKEIIAQVFSAFALNVTPTFKRGDVVLYDNKILHVQDMNWRFVTFTDRKNHSYYVPNSHLTSSPILNFSSPDSETTLEIEFEVSLKADPLVVIEIVKKAFMKNHYLNKKKDVEIYLNAMQNSFEFIVHFPAVHVFNNQILYQIKTELFLLLWEALKEEKIELYQGVNYVRATTVES